MPGSRCLARFIASVTLAVIFSLSANGFSSMGNRSIRFHPHNTKKFELNVHNVRDADILEQMIGGVRYSMVPMPEPMKATTAFVGNLCEFVNDKDLSDLFAQLSVLQSVPSCVVRKPDTTSLRYGFVSFPSVKEKEQAIIRFDGFEWRGRQLKVECIQEYPNRFGGVRIPEQLVEYVYGRTPKQSPQRAPPKKQKKKARSFRLNDVDKAEFERATRKGYLSLSKQQKPETSPLLRVHREWCESKDKPQIVLYKSVGQSTVDQVVIDLSTMVLDNVLANSALFESQILEAATNAGMDRCKNNNQDAGEDNGVDDFETEPCLPVDPFDASDGASWISDLSSILFGGVRSNAKYMASQLAILWDIPFTDDLAFNGEPVRQSHNDYRKKKKRRLHDHKPRRRGGGHRQAW